MFPAIAHGARNVLIGWILLFQGLVFGDMCGIFSCNPAESGGWTLSWERYEENGVEKSGYFLRKPSSGIYRIFNLRETRGHAHVFLYLYPELERFVVFNPIAEHHKENRLLIYSFKGQLLHSLGIPDLLQEGEMDYPVSNMHILPFREDGNSAPLVKQLTDPLRMVVVTHAGRHVAITVADGKAQEVEAGLFVSPSANFDAERVRKALQELLLALPPLPKDARPALYTIRHGVEVTADELPMFHSEGVWISPPVNGTARAVGYVVDQESVRLQDSANPNPNPDAPLRMELRPLEMAAVLEHAQRLSSLSDTRRFDTHRREIPRDHGEALLFAARLFETGHPEAAIQLAAFYLNTFGEEEMERETGDALRDHLYRDILRAFHLDHDTLRFVTAVRTLLTIEGIPLLANIPPERAARKDSRSPSGSSEPDPFQSDPFEPNPFAAEPGTPSPFDPPVPERFVPRNSWWCGKEMDQVVKKWSQVLTLPDGDAPTPPNLLIEETERRLYRKWYALRRPLAEASLLLSEKNWLLLPENLARQAIEDSMNLYFKPEDLPKQLEQEPFIRRILRENEELAAIFPAMLHDTRPVPGRTVSIRRLQPAMGGSYLKELEVPVLMSDIATEMLMGIKVPNGMIWEWREPEMSEAVKAWLQDRIAGDNDERALFYLRQAHTHEFPEEALYTLMSSASARNKENITPWIQGGTDKFDKLFRVLKDYRRVDPIQADKWISLLSEHLDALPPDKQNFMELPKLRADMAHHLLMSGNPQGGRERKEKPPFEAYDRFRHYLPSKADTPPK